MDITQFYDRNDVDLIAGTLICLKGKKLNIIESLLENYGNIPTDLENGFCANSGRNI